MKKATLIVMCNDDEAEEIVHEMINSDLAQYGLFCWGIRIEDCTSEEEKEVRSQLADEMLKEGGN